MAHGGAADDFQVIRTRMEELRQERERVDDAETNMRQCGFGFPVPMAIQ